MENIDWKMVSLGFSVFTWITGLVAFCIFKWNDLAHLEKKVQRVEDKQDDTIKELGNLSKEVAFLSGRQNIKE